MEGLPVINVLFQNFPSSKYVVTSFEGWIPKGKQQTVSLIKHNFISVFGHWRTWN